MLPLRVQDKQNDNGETVSGYLVKCHSLSRVDVESLIQVFFGDYRPMPSNAVNGRTVTVLDSCYLPRPPSVWVVDPAYNSTGTVTVVRPRPSRIVRSRRAALGSSACQWQLRNLPVHNSSTNQRRTMTQSNRAMKPSSVFGLFVLPNRWHRTQTTR